MTFNPMVSKIVSTRYTRVAVFRYRLDLILGYLYFLRQVCTYVTFPLPHKPTLNFPKTCVL
jgi:hypothetical protein